MPRSRMIKPEFWTSEQIMRLSIPARLLFVGTWNHADDGGVLPASICKLKMLIYPADKFDLHEIGLLVDELLAEKLLEPFSVDGKDYWRITGWHHQVVDYPSYRYPRSKEFGEAAKTKRIQLNSSSPNLHRTFTEPSLAIGEKRIGEKRREEKRNSIDRTPDKIFDYESEGAELKTRVVSKVKEVHRKLWPNLSTLTEQNRQEVAMACYIAEVLLSQDWLETALEKTAQKKADKPGAYLRICLNEGAATLGYDYHNLLSHVKRPEKKRSIKAP